jgi:hypothetical protein
MDTAEKCRKRHWQFSYEISDIESHNDILKGQINSWTKVQLCLRFMSLLSFPPEKIIETHDWAINTVSE